VRNRAIPIVACLVAAAVATTAAAPSARAADDATTRAASHYDMGVRLFEAREPEQALIEFQQANELKPRPAALFMMAQCEYLLGRLKDARAHYQLYAGENPDGEFVALAKDRIQSIDKRPSTFVINSVPDDVTVRIVPDGRPGPAVTGQAPNNFEIPRGRYRIDVTKQNYQGQTRIVDVDVAETKPLFFKLEPIPARLEIETLPPGATLYVNGNRARNPYRQDVLPGHFEIFAEATDHEPKTIEFTLSPGQLHLLTGENSLHLPYVQRSGRPELLFASTFIGGFIGAGAVAAAIGKDLEDPGVASVLLLGGGGVAGAIAGYLVATPIVPRYIPDNRALFILGSMWIGAAEGAGVGLVYRQNQQHNETLNPKGPLPCPGCRGSIGQQLRASFVGSLPGIAVGLGTGAFLAKKAPTYGRVALIQSAALGGIFAGGLVQVATQRRPYGMAWERSTQTLLLDSTHPLGARDCIMDPNDNKQQICNVQDHNAFDLAPGALIGLNVGLVSGLLGAYLPDQSRYGPTWKRVALIDLGAAAGALAGGVGGCVAEVNSCLKAANPSDRARSIAAMSALGGGAVGLAAGWFLTRHYDDDQPQQSAPPPVSMSATLIPMRAADGTMMPGIGAFGTF
jgi:hypothetical protein